jgi:hypothetical protein
MLPATTNVSPAKYPVPEFVIVTPYTEPVLLILKSAVEPEPVGYVYATLG